MAPPKDSTDTEKWKRFFENNFEDVHVAACTIVLDNDMLVKALLRRRKLLLDLQNMLPIGEVCDVHNLEGTARRCPDLPSYKKWLCFATPKDIYAFICREVKTIKKLSLNKYNVKKVFITFETEHAACKVLEEMTFPRLRRKLVNKRHTKFKL